MSRISHIRIYPSDWRSGCLGLTFEQEGLYIRMCMFIAETNRRVPLDDSQAARALNGNINQYRKILGQLLISGKITRHEDGYGNDRVEHERAIAQAEADRKFAASAEGKSSRQTHSRQRGQDCSTPVATTRVTQGVTPLATPPVEGKNHQQNQYPFIEPESEPYSPPTPKGEFEDALRCDAVIVQQIHALKTTAAAMAASQPKAKPTNRGPMPTFNAGCVPGITFANGRFALDGEQQAFWLERFDGDQRALTLAIDNAAANHNPGSRLPPEATLSRTLTRIALDRHQRAKNYERAVAANASAGKRHPSADAPFKLDARTRLNVQPAPDVF